MKRRIVYAAAVLCGLLALTSCQAVFTYSPVAFLQRDLANLSEPQQLARAEQLLVSGTTEEILEAYNAVAAIIAAGGSGASTENNLLAADLAFAASGLSDVFESVLENPDILSSPTQSELEELFASFDVDLVAAGASYIQVAASDEDAEISDTQYLLAGAALLASAAEQANSFDIIDAPPAEGDAGYDDYQEAISFLAAGGVDDLAALFAM